MSLSRAGSTLAQVPQDAYGFGEDASREADRLAAVEGALDPPTWSALLEVGVDVGWRCWDVGTGRGSIARWLARVVGPRGKVLATDLEDRRLDTNAPTVEFKRHDVSRDPAPGGDFDLVHARLLLEHLADPKAAITGFVGALKPGGVLIAGDAAGLQFRVIPATPLFERLASPWERAARTVGWNPTYGASLMDDLRSAGLTDIRGREHRLLAPGGPDWLHVRSGLERLRAELVNEGFAERDLDPALECLDDPENLISGPPIVIGWGRRR